MQENLTQYFYQVGFGSVWKENLGELSGGQRSLVALSLILAMLLLKPAPIYILDEVDAALDLSHTQNIGTMLKQQFQKSQFVIVSLKVCQNSYQELKVPFRMVCTRTLLFYTVPNSSTEFQPSPGLHL